MRDLTNKDNFTIIAALKASTFTYTFRNSKGATVNLSLPEAEGLFKTDASVAVSVTNDGKIVVNAPRYVGVVSWKGDTISKELGKARKFAQGFGAVGYEAPRVFAVAATAADIERVREATLPGRGAQLRAKAPSKTTARSKSRSATRRRMDLVR